MKKIFQQFKITIALLMLIPHLVLSQQAGLDSVAKNFDNYRKQSLQEKLYLHVDQRLYLVGETIWFSIFYVDGTFHKPLDLSKVAYIEVLDKENQNVLQAKVDLKKGRGQGSFFLPATLNSGNYVLRAYTQWMKNFPPEFYFHQDITIINPFVKPEFEKSKPTPLHVEFFPEGGYLISGIKSKIGFKVNESSGEGSHFKGAVINSANDTLAHFTPLKFGIGNFFFTPLANEHYRAVIKEKNGNTSIHDLPAAKEEGYTMQLKDSTDQLLKITVTGKLKEQRELLFVFLFAHSRQVISKAEAKPLFHQQSVFVVRKNDLPPGISHFTILDNNQQPVCERLYFKQPGSQLLLNATTDKEEYRQRRKVILQLESILESKKNTADMSVAVHKLDSLSGKDPQDIKPYLWLTSDLKGFVESPEFYFNENDPVVKEAADNLMITHGWRRFKWEDIMANNLKREHIPEYRNHIINGKVASNGTSVEGNLTYLSVPGKMVRLFASRSDAKGNVQYETNGLYGQQKFIALASTSDSGVPAVEIKSPFSTQFTPQISKPFQLSPSQEKSLLSRAIAMQVQDVYYEDKTYQVMQTNLDSTSFYGKADETYYLDDYTRFPVMEEVLREYVPGVFVRKRKDGFHFIVINMVSGGVFEDEPMILLDGVPLFDADKIMTLDPLKIRKLEVVKRKYYLGALTMPGIVSFSTYKGDVAGIEMDPGTVSLNYDGLQLQREFYSPRYETQKQISSRLPDKRLLLYWNPKVVTDTNRNSQIEFYTSDVTGVFQIVIQGMTKNGAAASAVRNFTVK